MDQCHIVGVLCDQALVIVTAIGVLVTVAAVVFAGYQLLGVKEQTAIQNSQLGIQNQQLKDQHELLRIQNEQLRIQNEQLEVQGRREQKWATLQACFRWHTDPLLNEYAGYMWEASSGGKDYTRITPDGARKIKVLLNYLDGMAISLRQELFLREIVISHFENIIPKIWECSVLGLNCDRFRGAVIGNKDMLQDLGWLYGEIKGVKPRPAVRDTIIR